MRARAACSRAAAEQADCSWLTQLFSVALLAGQHRREVEKLRDDQSALMASVGDLRAVRAEADKLRAERDAAVARVAALEAQLAKGKR